MASENQDYKKDVLEESSQTKIVRPLGGLTFFNAEFGFLEALVRGFKSGFLKASEYRQLAQCESLDDVKLALGDTDYQTVLQSTTKMTPEIIHSKCQGKFVAEFEWLRSQAVGQLSTFLDFVTYEYLIQAISFCITSLIKGADSDKLLEKCHPLGRSPHLRSIMAFENFEGADGLVELYRTVLVDTPVSEYFALYFNKQVKGDQPSREIQRVYNENEIDVITNTLQKLWLEDFYSYTQELGGTTAEMMGELLDFEADRRAIAITINSFGTNLNDPFSRDTERKNLFCNFGTLYPEATMSSFSRVGDMNQLGQALEPYRVYRELWHKSQDGQTSFIDQLYLHGVKLHRLAFDSQSHFAAFYAFVKLKEQEERNIKWILSCINQKRTGKDRSRWIEIF